MKSNPGQNVWVIVSCFRFVVSLCHFLASFRRFDVSLCHFLASFRRHSRNFVLSSLCFVVSLFLFVTSLVISSRRCFVSLFCFTVSFRRFNCAGLGRGKGTFRMSITWSGYSPNMANLLRSEEWRSYLCRNIENIVNHLNERFDENEIEITATFFLELLHYFTFPPSWKVCCWELVKWSLLLVSMRNHYRDDCSSLQDAEDV